MDRSRYCLLQPHQHPRRRPTSSQPPLLQNPTPHPRRQLIHSPSKSSSQTIPIKKSGHKIAAPEIACKGTTFSGAHFPFSLPFAEFFRFLLAAPQIFCECVIFDLKCGKIAETDKFTSPTLANIKYLYYLCSAI